MYIYIEDYKRNICVPIKRVVENYWCQEYGLNILVNPVD